MKLLIPSLVALLALSPAALADPVSPSFNYQGRLDRNGAPANGSFDLKFELYSAAAGGDPVVPAIERPAQSLTNGLFTAELDFGGPAAFDGTAYWLALLARPAGVGDYLPAPGRTAIRPTPYALHALNAAKVKDGSITSSSLAPGAVGLAQLNALVAPAAAGQLLGFDGAGLSWLNPGGGGVGGGPWLLSGTTAIYNGGAVSMSGGGPGSFVVGAPNGESGASIVRGTGRVDMRFDGTLFKLVTGPAGGPPGSTNGIVVSTSGNVSITGGSSGTVIFGSPNGESGSSIVRGGNRADMRYDGTSLKLVAAAGAFPPATTNGLVISNSGNVGIGTANPLHTLDVAGNIRATNLVLGNNAGTSDAAIYSDSASSTRVVLWSLPANGLMDLVCKKGDVSSLTIRGGADLAEPFAMSHPGVEPGTVVVIDEKNPGKLKASSRAYDKKVAGIVSGANGIQPGISMIQEDKLEAGENVALSGRVYVKADTSAGSIEPGDLLTTSKTAGHAMKAADHSQAQGSIIGKAMTCLQEGEGMVLVLVTLQ